MSLPKMTTPVNNISLLDDLPNAVGGLSAAELKARFDKAGGDIQTFLNETLIPAIEKMGVDEGAARDAAIQAAIGALELDTTVENLQRAIAAAESRAKEYANTKDAANLTAAKQYADTKAAAAQAAAERAAASDAASKADAALLAAKSYAKQQNAVTLLNAKEYADEKIPTKLPNPQKLKFTGAATGEYDGSAEKTINIPTGGGDVPAVLGNLAAQIGNAAAGTIPVYAGDEAWVVKKLMDTYTGQESDTDLAGSLPTSEWVKKLAEAIAHGYQLTEADKKAIAALVAADEQVSLAVSTWLTDHPEATTTVQDGAVTDVKLSDDLYKQVMGDERHKLTEVEVTPIPECQGEADWVAANFDGSEYKVVTTFFTPLAKTPRYIKAVNKTSATTIKLRSGYARYRFANGADESAEGFAIGNAARNLHFFNNIQIAPGETLLYDLQEFGRKGCEYFQFIISPAAIGGPYTDAQFTAKLREQAEFYYVYDSYVPTYSLPDDSGEFLTDLPVRYVAQGINNTRTTRGFAVVPYYPNTTYNVRGGVYNTVLVNALSVLFLLDDAIFNGRDKGIAFTSGDCGHIPLIIGSSTTQYDTSVNGGADSKYQWAYVKTPPASELVGPKYVAIPMLAVNQDDATDKGEAYYKAIFDAENEKGPHNTYITRFSEQIPRSLYAQLAFPNPNYHDDGSKYYAMLTSASKSPLVGASWVLFGDSLTDNYGGHDLTGNYFATKIAREFNMSFDNRAKSGSNIYRGGSGNYTSVSGMIKLDEFTVEIDAGTTEQPDYITIAFGTNSFTAQLGTNADTSATDTSVYGATKRFIEVLREKCPKSVFGFVLSPKQNWGRSDPNNLRAVDAARTAIKAVCDEYGVPYIDMSTQSGITAAMLQDGIHISNEQSQNLYYHAMRRFMIGL